MPTMGRRETPVERYWKRQQAQQQRAAVDGWAAYYAQQAQQQAQQSPFPPQPQMPQPGRSPYVIGQPASGSVTPPAGPAGPGAPAPTPTQSPPTSDAGSSQNWYQPAGGNYFGATTGDANAGYQAYRSIADNTGSLAWDALMNNRDAQLELYNRAGGTSDSFANWLRNRGDTFYNRYVADSAAANDPGMQFSDWLYGKTGANIQHEYLRSAPESRNFFPGLMQPSARWVVGN